MRAVHRGAWVLVVLVLALTVPGSWTTGRAAAAGCDATDLGDRLPVLLVHGFQSSGEDWGTRERDAGSPEHPWELHGAVPGAPGTWIAEPFDYRAEHSVWVQGAGSTAPRRLAEQIACLADASATAGGPGQVALVGHSMGGQQIRCALVPSCSGGPEVAGRVAQVVTVGTPTLGSFLRPNRTADLAANAFGRVVQATCAARGAADRLPDGLRALVQDDPVSAGLCEWLPALGSSSAGRAFTVGSRELAALPSWPAGLPVHTVAAEVRFEYQIFNRSAAAYSVGDLVVGVDSARAGASDGPPGRLGSLGGTSTLDCGSLRYNQTLRPGSGVVPREVPNCWHMSEMTDVRVAQLVGDALARWSAEQRYPATETVVLRPVDGSGRPAAGFTVEDQTSAGSIDCDTFASPAAVDPGIHECGPTAAGARACWPTADPWEVLCMVDPFSTELVRYTTDGPVQPVALASGDPEAMGMELGDGSRCVSRIGGAWDSPVDHPDWFGTYGCSGGAVEGQVVWYTDAPDGGFDRSSPSWTVQAGPTRGPIGTQHVLRRYVVGTAAGGEERATVRFDGVGDLSLSTTAAELLARGYVDQGNLYEGPGAACVSYQDPGGGPWISVESATGRVLAISNGSGADLRTEVGDIGVGSTLADVRSAFPAPRYSIEEYLAADFGQGSDGVVVSTSSGSIGLSLDGDDAAAVVTYVNGVGLPGYAPTNAEDGC